MLGDLELVVKHREALVIASVGHPGPVLGPVHDSGGRVLCDVPSMRHVEKALDAGVDDIVLTPAYTGLPTNMLRPGIEAAGLDAEALPAGGKLEVEKDIDAGAQPRKR